MKNLSGRQKPNYLLDSSYVMCSCAKQPPEYCKKLDTECFEYYRLLRATDNNNGVFGKDSPFIRDIDCEPFINLDKFGCCQADNYISAMNDIIQNLYKGMKNYPQDSRQYQTLLNKYEYYSGCVSFALNQKDSAKPFRNYPCVLELIDSWFHTDDKTRMSNKLEVIARMKKMQDSYKKQIREAISELRRGSYQYLEDEGFASSLLKALPKAEEEKGYLNPPIWTDKKAVDSKKLLSYFDEEEKKKRELLNQELNAQSDMIKKVNECLNDVENWGHCKCASVFASDEDYDSNLVYIDDIDIILSDIKKLENKFYVALGRVRGFKAIAEKYGIVEETKKLENLVQKIYSNFTALSTEMAKLRSSIYERPIVTEDSFLVCRCGGIIKVVQNGSWINISKNRIESNIIDLIRHADKTLYEKCIERLNSSMSNDYKFSAIKAFNIVHGILIYATGTEKQNRDYIKDKECEEAHKPAPHVEITLRPARDVLKQAKYGEVAANAVTFLSGPYSWIGMGVTIALSTASIVESEKVISWEQINDIQSLIDIPIQIFKDSGEIPYLESIAEISNVYGVTSTCFSILEALVYKSYANFVGEIKVTVSTYCEEYQFRGKYNIMGDKEGEYTSSYKPIQKSDFLLKVPEDNKTTIKYKIYEDGMFQTGEITDFMW